VSKNIEKVCNKIFVLSNGCVPNRLEGKKILDLFIRVGWERIEKAEDADMIVVNLCGYNGTKITESIQTVNNLMACKHPSTKTILTGCIDKINPEFKNSFPFQHIFDFSEFSKFLTLPSETDKIYVSDQLIDILESTKKDIYNIVISKGCVGNCSYCVIRKARSPFRSKPIKDILDEFHGGIKKGFRKFILWADDLGCYGIDTSTSYIDLLKQLTASPKTDDFAIFLHRLNPQWIIEYFDEFQEILSSKKIRLVYAPIQSGSSRIIELMRRPYRMEDVVYSLRSIKIRFPEVFLKTDIMIGFPSETDEDIQQTINMIREVKFDDIVVFKYSGVSGAPAFYMENQVSEEDKERRLVRLWNEFPFLRFYIEMENDKFWIIDKKDGLKVRTQKNIYNMPL